VSLAPWLSPLPDAEEMRATDRWAIEEAQIPSLELMERAGEGLAAAVAGVAPHGLVVVVCGKGNNGGDGLVAARLLRAAWRDVRVLLLAAPEELRGDPAANLARLGEGGPQPRGSAGEPVHEPFSAARLHGAAVLVDCVLGTGFEGEPREPAAGAIAALNASDAPVVAADVPSGVDASSGEVAGAAVRAVATVTFAAAKPGLLVHPGKGHAGTVEVVDIGIPAPTPVAVRAGAIDGAVLDVVPPRKAGSTKFSSGHVLVCGGSPGLTGAPSMAAEAAMRAGAGYVTACVPEALQAIFAIRLLEVMTVGLPEEGAADVVLEKATRGSMVVGPGMGRLPHAEELARELARRAEVPLVLDADGLGAHAGRLEDLAGRGAATILTPHEGELARLLEVDAGDVRARRLHHAREAARRAGAIVVLKGDDTLVAAADGRVAINVLSAPALATAGTGDVLSGVVAAMLAKEVEPFAAACAAVRLHARAGQLAAVAAGSAEGVIASDVIAALPRARGG